MEHAGRRIDDEELAAQMRDSGLGTPATRAAIIDRLIQVQYVRRARRILTPTEKGIVLVSVLPEALKSPITTGQWEKALNEIGRGDSNRDEFMAGIRQLVINLIDESRNRKQGVEFPESARRQGPPPGERESLGACPICEDGEIKENSKAFYCTNWRRTRCTFTLWKNAFTKDEGTGPEMTPDIVRNLLERKNLVGKTGTLSLMGDAPWIQWEPNDGSPIRYGDGSSAADETGEAPVKKKGKTAKTTKKTTANKKSKTKKTTGSTKKRTASTKKEKSDQ